MILTALYAFNAVFFTFFTFVWSSRFGIDLLIKMMAFGAVVANLAALAVQLGFLIKV